MTSVTRRQVLAGASVGVTASMAGCTALGDGGPKYAVEPYLIDGPDDLGCVESVSVEQQSETFMFPFEREYHSITVSLVDGYGWATVIAEWGNNFEQGEVEETVGNGESSLSFEVENLPSFFRLSVRCSDGEDINAVFRVVEQ